MLRFIKQFESMNILSLQTGTKLGVLLEPIINPNNLRIVAFHCKPQGEKKQRVVFIDDFREIGRNEVIVDSYDSLMPTDDLVRLQELLSINYQPIGKKVSVEKGQTIGRVADYTLDDQSFFVMKIYVRPTLAKSFLSNNMIVDRQQIIEVNNKEIIVKSTATKAPAGPRRNTEPEPVT